MTAVCHLGRRIHSLLTIELERAARTRTTWILAGAMLVVAALVSLAATSQAAAAATTALPAPVQELRTAFGGVAALRVFVVLLGVLCVTSEYHHGDIVWRYLAEPSRALVVATKAASCALIGALLGVLALQLGFLAVAVHGSPGATLGLSSVEAWHGVAGAVVGAALAGVLGVGIGAAVRNQTAALVGTLVIFLLVEPVITALAPKAASFLPSAAASAAAGGASPLGWIGGLALFAGYAVMAVVVGGLLCARSDV
ncbi:MAG: hypothetical protein LC799_31620 [Actinobacteria bacterium]|nr:hypothetical protein [Actinomycetota bacterium]